MSKNNNSKHHYQALHVQCNGDLAVYPSSSNDEDIITVTFHPDSRILLVEDDNVSSISHKNTQTLVKKMSGYSADFTAIISTEEGAMKVMNVHNVRTVRKDGVKHLRMDGSVRALDAVGSFAEHALEDIKSENNVSLSLFSVSASTSTEQIIDGVLYNNTTRTLTFLYLGTADPRQADPRQFSFRINNRNGGAMVRLYDDVRFTRLGPVWQVQISNSIDFTVSRSADISVWTTISRPDGALDTGTLIGQVLQRPVQVTI